MQKIKDRFVAGIVAGLLSNLVKQTIEWTAAALDISQETGSEKAAGFFLPQRQIKTRMGRAIGIAADHCIAAELGVIAVYLMTFTGKDHAIIKGTAIGNASWNAAYGVLARLGASSSTWRDPKTTIVSWAAHTAFGITNGYLIPRICDPSLFGKPNLTPPAQAEQTQASFPNRAHNTSAS